MTKHISTDLSVKSAYVYALYISGTIRYIGKGHGRRCYDHIRIARKRQRDEASGRSVRPHYLYDRLGLAISEGMDVVVLILRCGMSDDQARQTEKTLISAYGRTRFNPGASLWNLMEGGEGFTPEVAQRITRDPQFIERLRARSVGRAKTQTELEAISRGVRSAFADGSVIAKFSATRTGRKASTTHRENIAKGLRGIKRSDETRAKVALAANGRVRSQESIEKQRRALKALFEGPDREERIRRMKAGQKPATQEIKALRSARMRDPGVKAFMRQKIKDYWERRRSSNGGQNVDRDADGN